MKIHHLNCGSLKPPFPDVQSIVYCLLVETSLGLVLIDTGFGTQDYINPSWKMRFFLSWMGTPRKMDETAISQVKSLGYDPKNVKHIIQTHMHIDHAGGLPDFPWADVHIFETEYQALLKPRGAMEFAYIKDHWKHGPKWVRHQEPVVDWYGFEAVPILSTPEADFLFLPLPGHTRGHCGIAIGKPGNWLLHCGDAASPYHHGSDLHGHDQSVYKLGFLPDGFANRIMGEHIGKIRYLMASYGDEIQAISAHDVYSFRKFNSLK